MRLLLRLDILCCLFFSASTLVGFGNPLDNTVILARAYVPNGLFPQGEVRLIQRGSETIVQSVLQTRFVKRVRDHIAKNEQNNWRQHPDAAAYLRSLDEAFLEYQNRKESGKNEVALAIEFIDAPNAARVDFSFPMMSQDKHGFHVQPTKIWKSLKLSSDYIRKDQEHILVDAFKKRAADPLDHLHAYRIRQGYAEKK